MLQIRAYVPEARVEEVVTKLKEFDGVERVMRMGATEDGDVLVTGDVDPEAADPCFDLLAAMLPAAAVSLVRVDGVDSGAPRRGWLVRDPESLAWAEVIAEARASSRLLGRYLVLMAVAGVVAGVGVIEANVILIVGAMAISPDLLPLAAACVGIRAARPRLVGRAVTTLIVGLAVGTVAAACTGLLLRMIGTYSGVLGTSGIEGLTSTDPTTVIIALAAGAAALLTYESRAGAAVGVAISVTTIPASAYLGVVAISRQREDAAGALGVLITNVSCLLLAGTATLFVQSWYHHRRVRRSGT